jgi:hypothetical protein
VSWFRLTATTGTVAAGVLLAVAVALRASRRRWAAWASAAAIETALVCGLFALWQLANRLTHTRVAGGLARGHAVWDFERAVHMPSETTTQHLILGHPDIVRASNYYYATMHLTGMFLFLVWLWLRHRDRYARWRNVLVLFTGASLLVQMMPVAPPRLISGTGLVDTAMQYGQSVYAYVGSGFADQYAAMPSIHVGWALLIGAACYSIGTGPARWIGTAHAAITSFVVVATANHYWLDGIVAAAILAVAWVVQSSWSRASDPAAGELVMLVPAGGGIAVPGDRLHPVVPAGVGDDFG